MAAEEKVGLTLYIKDKASKVVEGLAKRVGLIKSAFAKVSKALKVFGFTVVVANQALELMSKGWSAIKSGITSSVQAAIELRGATDPLVKSFSRMQRKLRSIKGTIGTSFLAAFKGIGEAFEPAIDNLKTFLENNRKLIATKIVEYLFRAAQALTEGIAFGLNQANTIWHTLTSTIDLSIMSISKFVGAWSMAMLSIEFTEEGQRVLNERIEKMSEIYNAAEKRVKGAAGAHQDYADAIEAQRQALQRLIAVQKGPAKKAAGEAADAAGKTGTDTATQRINKFKERLGKLAPEIQEAFKKALKGKGRKEGMLIAEIFERDLDLISRRVQTLSKETLPKTAKMLEDSFSKIGIKFDFPIDEHNIELMRTLFDLGVKAQEAPLLFEKEDFNILWDKLDLTAEKLKAMREHQKKLNTDTVIYDTILANIPNLISGIGNEMGRVMMEVAAGQKKMGQAFAQLMQSALMLTIEVIKQGLMAYAVKTMGLIIAGEVESKGVLGLITGAIAAAAALSVFQGLISGMPTGQVQAFAQGGLVTGGVPNRDSVPAMLTPGEYVIPKRDVDAARSGGRESGSSVNMTINTAVPPSRGEMKRYIRQNLIPAMRDLKAQGVVV